jgi:hypothetical protein
MTVVVKRGNDQAKGEYEGLDVRGAPCLKLGPASHCGEIVEETDVSVCPSNTHDEQEYKFTCKCVAMMLST